jgi:rubrerythrin
MKKLFGFSAIGVGILLLGAAMARADEAAAGSTPAATVQPSAQATPVVKAKKTKKAKKAAKETWVCPMGDYSGPETADGKCPKCGMDLVKQEKEPVKNEGDKKDSAKPSAKVESPKTVWVCPMGDYSGAKTADGKCPSCGMDLVEKK